MYSVQVSLYKTSKVYANYSKYIYQDINSFYLLLFLYNDLGA